MTIGSTPALAAMIAADPDCKFPAENYSWYAASDVVALRDSTTIYGDGSCVLLVQDSTVAGVPHHSLWRQGPRVKGNSAIPAGAAIASGWENGLYPSSKHHNHAAIYLSSNTAGLVVIDQWPGIDLKLFRPHTLRFGNMHNYPSNNGDVFYVILTQNMHASR